MVNETVYTLTQLSLKTLKRSPALPTISSCVTWNTPRPLSELPRALSRAPVNRHLGPTKFLPGAWTRLSWFPSLAAGRALLRGLGNRAETTRNRSEKAAGSGGAICSSGQQMGRHVEQSRPWGQGSACTPNFSNSHEKLGVERGHRAP